MTRLRIPLGAALASVCFVLTVAAQDLPRDALAARQEFIRERIQRLENRMVELARLLAESEPEKAERLRNALEYAGKQRLRARSTDVARLLSSARLGEADRQQAELLSDLDQLRDLLSNTLNDFDRRREERKRLEALKAQVRKLLDEQQRHLYRTQRLERPGAAGDTQPNAAELAPSQQQDPRAPDEATPPENDVAPEAERQPAAQAPTDAQRAALMRQLEQEQRDTRARTDRATQQLQPERPTAAQQRAPAQQTPGLEPLQQAGEAMQEAADRLGREQLNEAEQAQADAVRQLQRALDDLDESLRQARREEREQTLAALATRLRQMLDLERDVATRVAVVAKQDVAQWTRIEELELSEALALHRSAIAACDTTLRIIRDEGTTVVVPALLDRVADDMRSVAGWLDQRRADVLTEATLADIIAELEQMLAAIERQQEEDREQSEQEPGGEQQNDGSQALLPRSAELKLVRETQKRLNEQSYELPGPEAETAPAERDLADRLGRRQRWLAEMTRALFEGSKQ